MASEISAAARTAMVDAYVDLLDAGGTLQLRTGAPPASIGDAAAGTLLAEYTLSAPAFGAGATGVASSLDVPMTDQGLADGTVGHFRVLDDGGAAVRHSDSVGVGSGELQLNTLDVVTGVDVEITTWTVTVPSGA